MTLPTSSERHFANVALVVITHLKTLAGIGGCSLTKPGENDWDTRVVYPFVLVTVPPAGGDNYIWAINTVEVEVFDRDQVVALEFSRLVHDRMMHLRHRYVGGVPISNVETINGPGWVDFQDPNIHRYLATYEVESSVNAQPL
ncbi:hypothetical protein [Nocardia pseudovaccinii]|uniref:hypothetical protein n=1 Tax=Nocardia pseudovaccinii TaxID=189540 RepID=UPI0007A45229|nr:hypothetical protein [Nocardia pseudovaccinii]